MKKRQHQATSKEAHESIKPAKQYYYEKIIDGLGRLKVGGTFEEVAKVSMIKPDQAWKRLSELVQQGKVYNTGITRPTSSGRKAMVRQLVGLKAIDATNPRTKDEQQASNTLKQLQLL